MRKKTSHLLFKRENNKMGVYFAVRFPLSEQNKEFLRENYSDSEQGFKLHNPTDKLIYLGSTWYPDLSKLTYYRGARWTNFNGTRLTYDLIK